MKKGLASLALLTSIPAMAQEVVTTSSATPFHVIVLYIMGGLCLAMVLLVITLYYVVNTMKHEMLGLKYQHQLQTEDVPFWDKVLSLKPLSAEKDIELDHDFDGIKELNNPIPVWFNVLFYSTVVFAVVYLVIYHVTESAPLQAKEYENQLVQAKIDRDEYVKNAGSLVDENNVTVLVDASAITKGQELYMAKCAVCHGDNGEGKVGPNLADEYWLHGGDVQSIFKTIKYGVPSKGMVAWQNSLNGGQIQEISSFILSLQGTNPVGAKEPQGDLFKVETTPNDSL